MADSLNKVPLDYRLEHEQLAQRQALAQALMGQVFQPRTGQMIGPNYASPGNAASFGAPIIQALLAKKMMDQNAETAGTLAEKYKGAIAGADPEKFGHKFETVMKDGRPVSVMVGDRGTLKPVDQYDAATEKKLSPVGTVYDPLTAQPGTQLGEKFGPTQMVNGEAVQFEGTTNKAHQVAARPTQVSVRQSSVNKGEDSFMKGVGEDAAKLVGDARRAKFMGQQTLNIADKLEALDKKGVFSGPTANVATTLSSLADTLGVPVDRSKLGTSQEYTSLLAKQVSDVLTNGSVGRSMTDADREAFMAQFPQLVSSPQGRQQIINRMRVAAKQDVDYADQVHANLNQNYPEAARLFNVAPTTQPFPVQANPTAPGPKRVRFEDLK